MNWAFILRLLLPEVLAILQATIKNPGSIATEVGILKEIDATIQQILAGLEPPTPASPAAQ